MKIPLPLIQNLGVDWTKCRENLILKATARGGKKVSGLPTYVSKSAFDFHNEDLSILYTKSGCTWSKCRENLKRQKPACVGQKLKDCRRICPILISFSLFSYWSLFLLDTKSWTWTKCKENLIKQKPACVGQKFKDAPTRMMRIVQPLDFEALLLRSPMIATFLLINPPIFYLEELLHYL